MVFFLKFCTHLQAMLIHALVDLSSPGFEQRIAWKKSKRGKGCYLAKDVT
jgi:hypothetical protein